MEAISEILTNITEQPKPTQTTSEEWKEWLPDVKKNLELWNLEDSPKGFSQLVAKVCSCENKKGVIFYGPTGSGKTVRMKFMARTSPADIEVRSARDICELWRDVACANMGNSALYEYFRCDRREYNMAVDKRMRVCDICIDDLGTESPQMNSFGNRVDVMRDVFLPMRYDIFPMGKTYITTNLYPDQLKDRYEIRNWSRFNEMFFFFPVEHEDRRCL